MNRLPILLLACAAAPAAVRPVFALPAPVQEEQAPLSAPELLAQGRALLAEGRAGEAEPLFARAVELSPGDFEARFWQVRCWVDLARINDSLDALDELSGAGRKGPEMDYLYGMAFHAKAKGYLATGVDGGSIAMSFGDATSFLESATQADPERFADAFHPLAEAAWHSQRLDLAADAVAEAVAREPKNAEARFLSGRIALSRYITAQGAGAPPEELDALLDQALAAFAGTLSALGEPRDAAGIRLAAQACYQTAYCHAWKQQHAELVEACAAALGWNPGDVDFGWVQSQMADTAEFLACLEDGSKRYAARYGAQDAGDATLRWWLGWANFSERKYEAAEREFADSVKKFPGYVNCWFYIGLSRYHLRNFEGAIDAFTTYWDVAPVDAVQSLGSARDANLAILDYLVGQCAQSGRLVDAGVLSEMQAETAKNVDRYWNNVGLFFRDGGEALARSDEPGNLRRAHELYEKSWQGYQRALALDPQNPAYLNDGAVLLHYYLDRELERAADMYRAAAENAERLLADENLSAEKRELFQIALRDSRNNLKLLEKKLEKQG